MKTEKELKEEILKQIALRFPNTKHKGMGKYGLYLYQEMDLREAINLTLQERNAEVKQAINDWANEEKQQGNKGYKNLVLRTKKELLQKLGLSEGEE